MLCPSPRLCTRPTSWIGAVSADWRRRRDSRKAEPARRIVTTPAELQPPRSGQFDRADQAIRSAGRGRPCQLRPQPRPCGPRETAPGAAQPHHQRRRRGPTVRRRHQADRLMREAVSWTRIEGRRASITEVTGGQHPELDRIGELEDRHGHVRAAAARCDGRGVGRLGAVRQRSLNGTAGAAAGRVDALSVRSDPPVPRRQRPRRPSPSLCCS
jgi:hypothetical protein